MTQSMYPSRVSLIRFPGAIRIFLLFMCAGILQSCKKDEERPEAPVIAFLSVSESEVVQFNNSVSISFSYEDWQGDLGQPDPDVYSLSVKDSRLEQADWYHLPPMTPELQELHISGTYTVHLDPLFLLGNGGQESVHFTLQVTDRSGHLSNEITTPEILVTDTL